ncbi:DNA-deoxyinosine glycosylase [Methanoregula sp. UBA64]|jgi:double-stranded uracil-DNA glycosylase|uniref:DNA-deoxyinosine glycosylase n=1 Tax=Methanoregula sp. UBA64 TaxID=1915554 RepID=UPI0025CC015E|nr:DNA-deoxyinosine glycosylase [Methanoregula sp. UBA64]
MTLGSSRSPGLAPVSGESPAVLILGSFPSVQSLAKREYYGNPQNRFWAIMENIFGIDRSLPYAARTAQLAKCRIALWDVLASCTRKGSADASIREIVPNDIAGFLEMHPSVRCIALNGTAAGKFFSRDTCPVPAIVLPSTSPANARQSLEEKTRIWSTCLAEYLH